MTTARIHGPPPDHIAELRERFRTATPWPHLVFDDVIDADVADRAVQEAVAIPRHELRVERTKRIHKLACSDPLLLGPTLAELIAELDAESFVRRVGEIMAIPDLVISPDHDRAALFITPAGGWQRLHEDFPKHPVTGLWARVIVIVYLSEWAPGAGGELDMWSRDMRTSALVEPRRGRMLLFETNAASRHGVLQVDPDGPDRIAVAARYYSPVAPAMKPGFGFRRTFRRPGETVLDVVPAPGDVITYLRPRLVRRRPSAPIGPVGSDEPR